MDRRTFISTLAGGLLGAPLAVDGQQAGNVHRVGYLGSSSATAYPRAAEAFRQGLRELGWVEGKNIAIHSRFAEGLLDRLPDIATELVRLKVDVIVASGTPSALAAKNATKTIPIVMIGTGDPIGLKLIASLARPGGNVTGLSFSVGSETTGKGLELLKETVPTVRRVAIISNPANPAHALTIRDLKVVARSLGVQLQLSETRESSGFVAAFAAMAKERAGALLVVPDPFFMSHRAGLADLAARNQLPSMYGYSEHVEAGGLMSYGPSVPDVYRHAAAFVDRIFKGAKAADLPVEQPTKFELVINLKTAKALGLTIPPSLLQRADQVIE